MRFTDTAQRVEVTIFDCQRHKWMQGGVTGLDLIKALANFTPMRYATRSQIATADEGQTFRWNGWLIRIHGDDGTTVTAGPQIYRKLTFIGTHDPDWVAPETHGKRPAERGHPDMLHSLLQDRQREGTPGSNCLVGMASALRDQVIQALDGHLVPETAQV